MDPLKPFHVAYTLGRTGLLRPARPDRTLRMIEAVYRWGPLAAAAKTSAIRYPEAVGLVDEPGELTFEQIQRRSNALAGAWRDAGLVEGDGVAILCRNHRGFVDATLACSKLGLRALYLNTDFAGPQIADVVRREDPRAIVFDEEFAELVGDAGERRMRFRGWVDHRAETGDPLLEDLVEQGGPREPAAPSETGSIVMLTSGTTGTPKGAPRQQPRSFGAAAALFSKVPFRVREATMVAAPLFHSLGFAHLTLALGLSSTLVVQRRFDPERTVRLTAEYGCTALVVVPIMLQRILELGEETLRRYDLSRLRIVFSAGSALAPELCVRAMDTFGDVLYNLYGSTEVAWASIATPQDLRAAPGTAGRPPRGTRVRILDEEGHPLPPGATGRIFVTNELQFEGYSGGGSKEVIDGFMSSGDVGHFDEAGRLFVDGRDDDMIVSGGENVFPQEVEELLTTHEAINEAAVVGVDDEEFGKRLRAFVVTADGAGVTEDEVKDYVRRNLARYKVPRDVVFVDELPRNPLGKILKRELGERA
jgi:acyl-CoA synthetase (AMP-forming)/AMP-acid ligase II